MVAVEWSSRIPTPLIFILIARRSSVSVVLKPSGVTITVSVYSLSQWELKPLLTWQPVMQLTGCASCHVNKGTANSSLQQSTVFQAVSSGSAPDSRAPNTSSKMRDSHCTMVKSDPQSWFFALPGIQVLFSPWMWCRTCSHWLSQPLNFCIQDQLHHALIFAILDCKKIITIFTCVMSPLHSAFNPTAMVLDRSQMSVHTQLYSPRYKNTFLFVCTVLPSSLNNVKWYEMLQWCWQLRVPSMTLTHVVILLNFKQFDREWIL